MTDPALERLAEGYADILNRLDPEDVAGVLSEISIETPHWDERTNLFAMAADDDLEQVLVLSSGGGDDYLLVRWDSRWIVDHRPVDWAAVEAAAFEED
jgi:hypothetical protein